MIDHLLALAARDNLLWIAAHWPALTAALAGGGGKALTGMPSGDGERTLPIDVTVSDLMREIEDHARFLGMVLMDETADFEPTTSAMPGLLRDVAMRYGHFTAEEDKTALDFCDQAEWYMGRVQKAIAPKAAPTYVGPCQECDADTFVSAGAEAGACRECGVSFTLAGQRQWLKVQMDECILTRTDTWRSLKSLGYNIAPSTVDGWIKRRLLPEFRIVIGPETEEVAAQPSMYKLADAIGIADQRMTRRDAA